MRNARCPLCEITGTSKLVLLLRSTWSGWSETRRTQQMNDRAANVYARSLIPTAPSHSELSDAWKCRKKNRTRSLPYDRSCAPFFTSTYDPKKPRNLFLLLDQLLPSLPYLVSNVRLPVLVAHIVASHTSQIGAMLLCCHAATYESWRSSV